MTKYTVTAERTAKWWVLQAEEAPGAISQVARLDQAEQIKEAIAFVTGEPEDTIEIDLRPVLPEAVERARLLASQYRELAAQSNAAAATLSRQAAQEMASAGLTVRDIGVVLGVSHQRAQQLATEQVVAGTVEAVGEVISKMYSTQASHLHRFAIEACEYLASDTVVESTSQRAGAAPIDEEHSYVEVAHHTHQR